MPPQRARAIIIAGPTSVGKTSVAIALARGIGARVVSADSMQVYRWMDIGTAKPTPEEMAGVPHYMIDVADPRHGYSVAEFLRGAAACIKWLDSRGIPVIVAGGTRLYLKALTDGLFSSPPKDPNARGLLAEEAKEVGTPALHTRLAAVDPETAARISPNDYKRIERALEVWEIMGVPISRLQREHTVAPGFEFEKLALIAPRAVLYDRVNRRVDEMMRVGWLDEVRTLLDMGVARHSTAMGGHGYRQLAAHLEGLATLDEAVEETKKIIRHYVKYQLMWLRLDPGSVPIDAHDRPPEHIAEDILDQLSGRGR